MWNDKGIVQLGSCFLDVPDKLTEVSLISCSLLMFKIFIKRKEKEKRSKAFFQD